MDLMVALTGLTLNTTLSATLLDMHTTNALQTTTWYTADLLS